MRTLAPRRAPAVAALLLLAAACTSPASRRGDAGSGDDDAGSLGGKDGGAKACAPSDPPSCADPSTVQLCRLDGSGYDYTPCAEGAACVAGACTCPAGTSKCVGQNLMKCGNDGQYHLDKTCPNGSSCTNGQCGDLRCDEELVSTNPHALPVLGWPRFRHDNRNTGVTTAVVAGTPKLKWKVKVGGTNLNFGGGMASGPVVNQDNVIFIGAGEGDGAGGAYYSFDPTGNKLFAFPAQRGYGISTPAVRNDATSYFSTTTSRLYAVTPKGAQQWIYNVQSQADSDPVITKDGTVVYSSDDGSVYALDPNGALLWKTNANAGPGEVDSGVAESCDGRVYVGGMKGWFALDVKTGATIWSVPASGSRGALLSSPVLTGDGKMFGFDSGGVGVGLDPKGAILWKKTYTSEGPGASAAYLNGTLYTVLRDGQLYAIDAGSGNVKWQRPTGDHTTTYLLAGPIIDGASRVYFNSSDGNVYAFDTNGNQLWKIPHSGVSTSPTWVGTMAIGKDGTLYVPGNDGTLYAFQ